ncbi:thiol reductant ABC exporter subunit CydC [Ectobacillus sp. JY-23]|uniref:thiol reductant ABC exporter subunit CydC n=1 Tax=Ectobacillus sp. JY-23 TaxID=2933872 RepID=UPI001FF12ED5|nr:thiol reductant ABC exporter subunit CydC [Ectobacillus sp. JY-23]UOY92441.1 thiol reductant ABC exporter subunit CydC [Ectobacillus sp. JY-23]
MNELLQIVRMMLREKRDSILSIVFGYIAGVVAVGLFAANGYLIAQAALTPPLYVLIGMVVVVKLGSILRAASRYGERYFSHRATFTMLGELRVHFFETLSAMLPSSLQRYRSGDLLSRIVGDVESMQNVFLRVVYPPLVMVTVFLSTIVFVSFYSLAVVVLLTIGLIGTGLIVPAWFAYRRRGQSGNIRETRAALATETTEWLQGFRELKIHGQLGDKKAQLLAASNTYITEQANAEQETIKAHAVNTVMSSLIVWAVLAVSGFLVAGGELDGLFLAMLVMISLTVFDHAAPMAALPLYYEESEQAAKRLKAVTEEAKRTLQNTLPGGNITFSDVSYTFPGDFRPALRDVSFCVPAGSKTAIVGASGSGKSTIAKLLLKLAEPDSGSIVIGETPLANVTSEAVWARAKVVLQENHFFAGTLEENLLCDNPENVRSLLEAVGLPHFASSSAVQEKGSNLSGGEKQRLAMARAICKSGDLWILDEPTSSLDDMTEQRIYDLLTQHAKTDTVLLISHRLEGLQHMDQIIVMDEGRIVESGTFAELMNKQGVFYELKQIESSMIGAKS